MREIISIDKDFLNNKETLTTKQKPKSMAKGKVTVSLFDEKGNKQREIKTENIVYDWVKAYSFKNTYLANFGLGTMGGQNNSASCIDDYTGVIPLSKYLMLFSGDHEDTNPKKSLIKDALVGYAGRYENYSGSDFLKGTYNKAESKTSIDEKGNIVFHMVYDFPTHSANGNITGIGLGHTTERNGDLIPYKVSMYNDTSSYPSMGVTKYNNAITSNNDNDLLMGVFTTTRTSNSPYLATRYKGIDNTFNTFALSSSLNYINKYSSDFASSTSSYYGYMGYDEKERKVFITYQNTGAVTIAKAQKYAEVTNCGNTIKIFAKVINDKLEETSIEKILLYDFSTLLDLKATNTMSYSTVADIYVSPLLHKDKFVVYIRTSKNTAICENTENKSYIFIFDIDGNYEKHTDITSLANFSSSKIIPYGEDEFLIVAGNGNFIKGKKDLSSVEKINISNLNIRNKDKIDLTNISNISYEYWAGNYNTKMLYASDKASSYESNYRIKDDRINLSSYTRLPSPVIKTNTHTMKVQYDLVIEDVSVYDYIEY